MFVVLEAEKERDENREGDIDVKRRVECLSRAALDTQTTEVDDPLVAG